jgi:hypothetical protein
MRNPTFRLSLLLEILFINFLPPDSKVWSEMREIKERHPENWERVRLK